MKNRLLVVAVTIVVAVFMTFLIVKLMPGDPVHVLANELRTTQGISEEQAVKRAITMLNYDPNKTIVEQMVQFVKGLVTGDLGTSIRFKTPVVNIIKAALPWTLFSAGLATILSYFVGTKMGLYVAWKQDKKANAITDIVSSIFGSVPDYVIGFLLVSIFAVQMGLLPSRGAYSATVDPGFSFAFIGSVLTHAILPVLSLFIVQFANWIVNMRGSAANVMNQEYIKYARARGLSNKVIRKQYVGKNASLPMITALGTTFGMLVGGAPLIENVFSYPGVGFFLNTGVAVRDIPLMQGLFFMIIMTVIVCNFIVDLLYGYIDPRLRRSHGAK
ncbi:ABC transporter permease [Vagococcus allomyrinae]